MPFSILLNTSDKAPDQIVWSEYSAGFIVAVPETHSEYKNL
jgi:hypothetical protein